MVMIEIRMHDWLLLDIHFAWADGRVTIRLRSNVSRSDNLIANDVSDLHVPKLKEWGPSSSINRIRGPDIDKSGAQKLEIEMQSGDVIKIEAMSFDFPAPAIFGVISE
jgi:hypothetical protein